jgi:hypothetical protein
MGPRSSDSGWPPPSEPGVYPPGVVPAVYATPIAPQTPAAPAARRRGGILLVALGAGVALFLKLILPILLGTAVSGVLTGVFSGPFDKLPADQKQTLEQRFEAAAGDTFEGLSEAETATRIDAMIRSGLPRLSDELLVEKIHLTSKLLMAADVPTCARVARASATGGNDGKALHDAVNALDTPAIGRWFDITVSAIEAAAADAPPERTVPQREADRVLGDIGGRFSEAEGRQFTALFSGGEVNDEDACGAARAIYNHMEELPPADLALAALFDASP